MNCINFRVFAYIVRHRANIIDMVSNMYTEFLKLITYTSAYQVKTQYMFVA